MNPQEKEQFADYETSKMLKELGFDENTNAWYPIIRKEVGRLVLHPQYFDYNDKDCFNKEYNRRCSAPLWQQVKQWLWGEHSLFMATMYLTTPDFCFIFVGHFFNF